MRISIDTFPNDDTERYVAAIGAVKKSKNPSAAILLDSISKKPNVPPIVHYVSLPELDVVRHGSIWQGQKHTGDFHSIKNRVVEEVFNIDLSSNVVRTKTLREINSELGYKNFSIPYIEFTKDKKPTYNNFWFKNATYNVIPCGQVNVIVSSLEILTATYAPTRKELRRMIMNQPQSVELLKYYLDLEKCSYDAITNECVLYPKVSAGDASFIFLAHLYCSDFTKQIYENIHSSMEVVELNALGKPYPHRYPEIKPYHEGNLIVTTDGIWLDDEKKNFLVLRINETYSPDHIKVRVIETSKTKIEGTSDDGLPAKAADNNTRTVTSPDGLRVKVDRNPAKRKKSVYMISEIQSHIQDGVLVRQTNVEFIEPDDYYDNDNDNDNDDNDDDDDDGDGEDSRKETVYVKTPGLEEINTSSGERVFNPKGVIREFRTVDSKSYKISQSTVVNDVISGLVTLSQDSNYGLELSFLDENCNSTTTETRISLKPHGNDETWTEKNEKARNVVFMQLKLKDRKNFYYICEIERLLQSENFRGIAIETTEKISVKLLSFILKHIVSQEGKTIDEQLLTKIVDDKKYIKTQLFKHNKGGLAWDKKMEKMIAKKLRYFRPLNN
ncbi:hypothetical protein [uncultured Rheinheimera sp.]|uniref:hypothetical protein n=1 Tax=uncultured Rheinheimera sp. TaxID=400532 RepID=UPI00259816F8|nr:hypothetical protein [uncultured Rheinheimera sp.]